jgi:Fe-S-cluster containining protein
MTEPHLDPDNPAIQFLQGLIVLAEKAVHETLGQERSRGAAIELSARILRIAEATLPQIAEMHPPAKPLACRSGCSHCCRLPTVVTDVPTVMRLGFVVASALPRETMNKVVQNLQTATRPCAFLVNDSCQVYADRPVVCRSYNAFDVSSCQKGQFLTVGSDEATGLDLGDPWPFGVGGALEEGMAAGLARLGIDARQVQMVAALRLLASDVEIADRWLKGEPAFEAVVAIP